MGHSYAMAVVLVLVSAMSASAGPFGFFGRFDNYQSGCANGGCEVQAMPRYTVVQHAQPVVRSVPMDNAPLEPVPVRMDNTTINVEVSHGQYTTMPSARRSVRVVARVRANQPVRRGLSRVIFWR